MNSIFRNILVWVVLGSLLIYVFDNIENSTAREQISYSQFKEEVLSDRIAKVVFQGDQMTITGDRLDGSKFETVHPIFKKDDAVDRAIYMVTAFSWSLSNYFITRDIFLFYETNARWYVRQRRANVIWKE